MPQTLLPLIHKAKVQGLTVHIARSGIALGDEVEALALEDGVVGVRAKVRARMLGVLPMRRSRVIGHFGPKASQLLLPELDRGEGMRLRVVGLTPEFLAGPSGPELHVSVWVRP